MVKKVFLQTLIFIAIMHGMALVLLISTVSKFDCVPAKHKNKIIFFRYDVAYMKSSNLQQLQ